MKSVCDNDDRLQEITKSYNYYNFITTVKRDVRLQSVVHYTSIT